MEHTYLPIEAQLEIERLKLHLENHPEQAFQLAIKHFQDYLWILLEYKKLMQQRQSLSLAHFSTSCQVELETEYEDPDTFCLF